MSKIQELPKSSSRLLTSSQIISSVFCVVKELLENALDSSAKNIEIKLDDYGLDKIEVKDNGCGIDRNDIQFAAKPHCTSKITSYYDLSKVNTYGFRGEALGAITAVADLIITTKSCGESIGSTCNFGHDGQVLTVKPCACAPGTTVSVLNLFKNIPVRRQYYRSEKNKKDELRKVEELLSSYGIIKHDIRFALYHNRNLIWQKPVLSCTKDALIQSMGNAVFDRMKCIDYDDEENQRKFEIYLPEPDAPLTCSLTSSSKCIVSVNKRPVKIKAIEKLLKDYYNESIKNSGRARYPICYISLTVPSAEIDANVEPNKISIMLHHSEEVFLQFSDILKNFYSCDEINKNHLLAQEPLLQDSSLNQKQKSNAEDFLCSLKMACDKKTQQTVLSVDAGRVKTVGHSTPLKPHYAITKNDVCKIGNVDEPCKKKLKTNSKPSQDLNHHISTLKDFFSNETNVKDKTLSNGVNAMSSVTVQRVSAGPFGESTFEVSRTSTAATGAGLNRAATSICADMSDAFSNQGKSNDSIAPSSTVAFHASSNRITTCAKNGDSTDKTDCSVVPGQERLASKVPEATSKLADSFVNKISVHNQNGISWSRGVHPSGELVQPVAVLQPKVITNPDSTSNETSAGKEVQNSPPKLNKKSPPKQILLSFDRKLTAFDIFCRNNRLEVAARNPDFNNHQIAQVLSEKWSQLSMEERAVFKNMLDKNYPKEVKKKERLGKTISQNLSQDKKDVVLVKGPKRKFKVKPRSKSIICNMEHLKTSCNKMRCSHSPEDVQIVNRLAPGIWVCLKENRLYLLNTFRLQETIIYQRLLETFEFDAEPLDAPATIPTSHLGDEATATLSHLSEITRGTSGDICSQLLRANGFHVRITEGIGGEVTIEMLGIANCSAFYGVSDLKELLLLIKEKGYSAKLSECRPAKNILYLQSEANRMSRRNPACQRLQDVEDLLAQKVSLIPNCNKCMHHKTFFHELWHIDQSENSDT